MVELERVPTEEIEKLLECEVNGEIYKQNQVLVIDNTFQEAIYELMLEEKRLDEQKKKLSEKLLQLMEENGVKKFDNEYFSVSYVAETTRNTFDSKTAIEKYPDLSDCYKSSVVKPSVRIKLK